MKNILALATHYNGANSAMGYAADLAVSLDAVLTGIFVSEPVPLVGIPLAFPEAYTLTADIAREAEAAEPAMRKGIAAHGLERFRWQVAEGPADAVLERAADWNDVLVLQAGEDARWSSVAALGRILLTCGVPCIVVPASKPCSAALDTVAVAWNDSPQSMRALHAALPLLKRARNVVLLNGVSEPRFPPIVWRPPFDLDDYFTSHGIRCVKQDFEASGEAAGRKLLAAAKSAGATLLVMGAYGHGRVNEWMLGGATRHVLENPELPIFMRH